PVSIPKVPKKQQEQSACLLLREIFGNPFATPRIDPVWLAHDGGVVGRLARAIDAERTFDRLPILGDALEEAGCHDEPILRHCRNAGVSHVRGCWVVELILNQSSLAEVESTLILPRAAWLVTYRVRGRKGDPLSEKVRRHLIPLLAKTDPEFVIARECPVELLHD